MFTCPQNDNKMTYGLSLPRAHVVILLNTMNRTFILTRSIEASLIIALMHFVSAVLNTCFHLLHLNLEVYTQNTSIKHVVSNVIVVCSPLLFMALALTGFSVTSLGIFGAG